MGVFHACTSSFLPSSILAQHSELCFLYSMGPHGHWSLPCAALVPVWAAAAVLGTPHTRRALLPPFIVFTALLTHTSQALWPVLGLASHWNPWAHTESKSQHGVLCQQVSTGFRARLEHDPVFQTLSR